MNQEPENLFEAASPEQRFYILAAELVTPIDTILGYAYLLKKDVESNKMDPEEKLKKVNIIVETADKIKKIRDDLIRA
jgi:hypothetical protein